MYQKTLYTEAGLQKLGEIVRAARGDRSFRDMERLTGVSHAVIRRLELAEIKNPDDTTLVRIAPRTAFSFEELKAIAQERHRAPVRKYRIAEDLLPFVDSLPPQEMARLAQLIIAKLIKN